METPDKRSSSLIGAETVPPPPRVNSLQALTRLRAKKGCDWCTFAFVLNQDMIKPDGTLDDLHALVFPLGSFSEQSQAEDHAKNVIAITKHPGVIAARYGVPVPLTTKFNPEAVTEVRLDNGRIVELENAQYKREQEEYERRIKQERDLVKEAEEETNTESIEHFKRQCYLAIKNRASYQVHMREADAAWQSYKKREMAVRDHFARHPEHEKEWLPYLKQKLAERGEMNLYLGIEAAYNEIHDELLGLTESDNENCPGGVCAVSDCPDGVCVVSSQELNSSNERDDEIISAEEAASETPQKDDTKTTVIVPGLRGKLIL